MPTEKEIEAVMRAIAHDNNDMPWGSDLITLLAKNIPHRFESVRNVDAAMYLYRIAKLALITAESVRKKESKAPWARNVDLQPTDKLTEKEMQQLADSILPYKTPTKQCRHCQGRGDRLADGRGCQHCMDTGRVPA